jgi:TRAP-type C4-dicarboxylate transport system substrate-binding protein
MNLVNLMMMRILTKRSFVMQKVISTKHFFLLALVFFVFNALSPELLHAQRQRTITINLASSLPRNSPWGRSLDRIAADWVKATNGEVTLHVFHQYPGSEMEYLMKMRQDKIQAAVFTSLGLNSVAPEIMALSIPFLIRNDGELDAVLAEVRPLLDARIEDAGYANIAWIKAGWVKIFSKAPLFTPNDTRRIKMGSISDEPQLTDAFRSMGYNIVPATPTDMTQKLNSGLVDAIYLSPTVVSVIQLQRITKNMSSINLAPFMGGILMSRKAWAGIPAKYQAPLKEIVKKAGLEIENSFQKSEADAVISMQQDGLIVNTPSPEQEQEWYRDTQQYLPDLINRGVFNKDMYDRIQGILQKYRQGR